MTFTVVKIDSKNYHEYKQKVDRYCENVFKDTNEASSINYDNIDYKNKSYTFLYCLLEEKRFDDKNSFYFIEKNNEFVAGSGGYVSDFDEETYIIGVRLYTTPQFRSRWLHSKYIYPKLEKDALNNQCSFCLITFNEYNLRVYNMIKNKKTLSHFFPEQWKNWNIINRPLNIKNTTQYCMYKELNDKKFVIERYKPIFL